jgi:hypothetical protein
MTEMKSRLLLSILTGIIFMLMSGIIRLKDVLIVHSDPNVVPLLAAYYRKLFPNINFMIPRRGEQYPFKN